MHSQYQDHVWGPQVKDPSLKSPLAALLPPSPHLKACLAQAPSQPPVSPGRHNASQEQAGPGRGDQGTPEGHRWPEEQGHPKLCLQKAGSPSASGAEGSRCHHHPRPCPWVCTGTRMHVSTGKQ